MFIRCATLALALAAGASTVVLAQTSYSQPTPPKPAGYAQPAAKPAGGYGGATTPAKGGYAPAGAPSGYGPGPGGYGNNESGSIDFPPNAHPGQCFARVMVPPVIDIKHERVLDIAEHTDLRVIPAVYGWEDKEVVIKEARTEYVTVPATYKTITETVTLREATVRKETIAAVYRDEEERILVREAYTTWKKGVGLAASVTKVGTQTRISPTGEILCLVEVPAEYKKVMHKVLIKAEETREISVPAETQIVTRQVIDTPAKVIEHKIPAITKTVKIRITATPERTETITIPAVYREVDKDVITSGGKVEWREILCDTNTTREVIVRVQTALETKGFYRGKHTGVFGRDSWQALVSFQHANHLPEGQLTIETVRALNISL